MRPQKYYVCYANGLAFAIHQGTAAARRACGGRRDYWSFKTLLEAEEWFCWWNYKAYLPGGHLHHTVQRVSGLPTTGQASAPRTDNGAITALRPTNGPNCANTIAQTFYARHPF